jgi:hypothetical protein
LHTGFHVKGHVDVSGFNETIFFWKFDGKIIQKSKLKEILPIGDKVFHSSGKTNGWAEKTRAM